MKTVLLTDVAWVKLKVKEGQSCQSSQETFLPLRLADIKLHLPVKGCFTGNRPVGQILMPRFYREFVTTFQRDGLFAAKMAPHLNSTQLLSTKACISKSELCRE